MKVVIKGLQRSGTNILVGVVEANWPGTSCLWNWASRGGKHMDFVGGPPKAPLLVTVKDPYCWMHSIYRHSKKPGRSAYSQARDFQSYLRRDLIMPTPCGSTYHYRPATAWNERNAGWLSVSDRPVVFVNCEDWLNPKLAERAAKKLQKVLGKRKTRKLKVPARVPVNRTFDRSYYRERRWLKAFRDGDLVYVNSLLDIGLIERLGYECVLP